MASEGAAGPPAAGEDMIVNCEHCEHCDSANFRIMYDAKVGGYHAECAKCGTVFLGLR